MYKSSDFERNFKDIIFYFCVIFFANKKLLTLSLLSDKYQDRYYKEMEEERGKYNKNKIALGGVFT